MRRTKIISTIGPASESSHVLESLIAAGMDVARLNSSHSDIPDLAERLKAVREAADRANRPVAVMLDLAGPKLRIGEMSEGTVLEPGSTFTLVTGDCTGDASRACITYPDLAHDLSPSDRLLIDDGQIELSITDIEDDSIVTRVEVGGKLTSNKGVNAPGASLKIDAITEQDREVLAWGLEAGVDLVAMSFVRTAADVHSLRELLGGKDVPIVSKIEKHEATAHITEIVEASDAVMVARGDLGVETSPEAVPVLQRRIISESRKAGVPVIVATQMLESMTSAPRPTRAEASDVANAIFDGVDAVMLSAETAVGSYPVQTVSTMSRIVVRAEEEMGLAPRSKRRRSAGRTGDLTQAVSAAVCDLAEDLGVAAIVTATQSGSTARAVAKHRPAVPIVAVTPSPAVARRLQVVWGIRSRVIGLADDTDVMLDCVMDAVTEAGYSKPGQRVAITAGISTRAAGLTDFILVREIHEEHCPSQAQG